MLKTKIGNTGHAEIDEQHSILEGVFKKLSKFCRHELIGSIGLCKSCPKDHQHCLTELLALINELLEFARGHCSYEEKLMELLPETVDCSKHVNKHKESHKIVLSRLQELLRDAGHYEPNTILLNTTPIITEWIEHHTPNLDIFLANTKDDLIPEGGFDFQLVALLDKHAFPFRPKRIYKQIALATSAHDRYNRILQRYKTLTPTQKTIFWLVTSGNTSKQIAAQMNISINTVKSHRTAIYQKMEINSVHKLRGKADMLKNK